MDITNSWYGLIGVLACAGIAVLLLAVALVVVFVLVVKKKKPPKGPGPS